MRHYASAAIPVPEEEWSKTQNTQPKWKEWKGGEEWVEKWIASGEEWNVYIREEEPPKERKPRPKQFAQRPTLTPHQDTIHIPRPSYGYGSTFRSRFAFGKVTNKQARKHTAEQTRYIEHENPTSVEETPIENPDEQPEEEDPFQDDRLPNQDECA